MVTFLTSDHQRSEPVNIPLVQIAASEVKMPSVITLIKCLLPFYQHFNNINIFTVLAVELGIFGVIFKTKILTISDLGGITRDCCYL